MSGLTNKYGNNASDLSLDDIVSELRTQGYTIESVASSGSTITGISLDQSTISISANGTATITVSYNGGTSGNSYYAVIKGKYYLMELNDNGVKVSRTASDISASSSSSELTAESNNSNVTIGSISGNTITLNGGASVGSSTITVSYGSYTATCSASVVVTPTSTSVADASKTFSTAYGTIDVIWLNTDNSVRTTPNPPTLTSNGETMTPVKWTETTGGWEDTPVETTSGDSDWYRYNAVSTREESGATTDNITSHWANAKTSNGAFFVWIPRYAYRITYYSSATSTDPTGYYDGWGLWKAEDGSVKLALDSGVETVTYNGNKYIVHPAFETNLDLGGWSSDLSGFWFAKYEMSGSSYSALTSIPNTASKRSQNIGTQYLWGRQATYGFTGTSETLSSNGTNYTYTSYMNSHMMKNSEWGAVAYLTQSQYGRNGNEIDLNGSTSYITGNGGGAVGGTAPTASGTQNAYNTTLGAKASTTGNIYGIYDMSGGAWERAAAYYSEGSTTYTEGSSYGLSMTQEAKDSSGNYTSTKYITKYGGSSSSSGNAVVYTYGKIGDSTKEVNLGGQDTNSATTYRANWFGDYSYLAYSSYPFFVRGGYCRGGASAGVFYSNYTYGYSDSSSSFRAVLCP